MEKAKRNAISRHSDQKYYLTKLLCEKYLSVHPNPEYTVDDNKKKLEIFNIPNNKTCFITGLASNGTGDHIYEINNYHKYTGRRGINDQWNIVPVVGSVNKKYKKIMFTMPNGVSVKKDIGYQELLEIEQNSLLRNDATIYRQLQDWKQYVTKRGAKMSFEETPEFIQIREEFHRNYNNMWEMTLNSISSTNVQ